MSKGGRPAGFLGCKAVHRRIRFRNSSGRTRAFYARWRPNLKAWECHLQGYGLKHRQWFSKTQTLALHRIRTLRSLDPQLWRKIFVDTSVSWDGIRDLGYSVDGVTDAQAFTDWGAGDASPAVTKEPALVDHDGLEVGELPADQFSRYFPAHAFFQALA